ncbi:MAG: methyltransferase domain-containing protein [Deltaproteobacteria bacterium]|nr:methyltransferase domain-containing protein [Deltaproteobacteria bacterium]
MTTDAGDFAKKVKGVVRKNFNQSAQIYRAFEEKHHFFYTLTRKLAEWMDLQSQSRVLDIGCGNGISCEALRELYDATVFGIDLSEAMIEDAKSRLQNDRIHLVVGDGEHLSAFFEAEDFDAVMYNASIFVFPNPKKSFLEAKRLMKTGGVVGFSFYPRVYTSENLDLIGWAYEKLGLPIPRFRTITPWEKACRMLQEAFGTLQTTTYEMPGSVDFLVDFFSIPAQSASLFPKQPYEERAKSVKALFETLAPWEDRMTIGWDMAKAVKKP